MSFQFSESHIVEHRMLGYTVFRQIILPSLLRDLRQACSKGHELARKSNPRAMRMAVNRDGEYGKAFEDYANLPELNTAIQWVLTPQHNSRGSTSILIETADIPVCQAWQRDFRGTHIEAEHVEEYRRFQYDSRLINQINCPLYEDYCPWFVRGSQLRPDLPSEIKAANSEILKGDGFTYEEREQLELRYCRDMPGRACLAMDGGDFALYKPLAWHLGTVLPYKLRATIHEIPFSPESQAYHSLLRKWVAEKAAKKEQASATVA